MDYWILILALVIVLVINYYILRISFKQGYQKGANDVLKQWKDTLETIKGDE